MTDMTPFRLADYASLRVSGPDATRFLQSQLSSDVAAVGPARGQLSAWHDPKGRVLAVLTVMADPDGYLLVLPAALVEGVRRRLSMFVLRAKVGIEPGPSVAGLHGPLDGAAGARPWDTATVAGGMALRLPGPERWLLAGPAADAAGEDALARAAWELQSVEAGLPEVYPDTAGTFVAQMLNLDELGAVSFTKGCYPGQEIIARARYLGRVKRRARLFRRPGPPPAPGDAISDPDGTVVRSAPLGEESLVLAVVADPQAA